MVMTKRKKKTAFQTSGKHKRLYCRQRDLPGLTGLWPAELEDPGKVGSSRIIPLLRNALRIERQRGKSGNWCYNINRHMALKHALSEEIAAMREKARRVNAMPLRLTRPSELHGQGIWRSMSLQIRGANIKLAMQV